MTRIRPLFCVLTIALLVGGWSLGDDTKTANKQDPPVKLKGQLPPNWKKLGLGEDQVQKIYKIQNDYDAKLAALQLKIQMLKQEERADLMKILTDAQKARLKEISEGKVPETGTKPEEKK